MLTSENFYSAVIMRCEEVVNEEELSLEDKAMSRLITESFVEYAAITSQITDEVVDKIISEENTVKKADKIANELFVLPAKKQKVLSALDFSDRLKVLCEIIVEENEIALVEKELSHKVKESIDKGQREYYLREKLKAI